MVRIFFSHSTLMIFVSHSTLLIFVAADIRLPTAKSPIVDLRVPIGMR